MRVARALSGCALLLMTASGAAAASDSIRVERSSALALPEASQLDPGIRIYWIGEPHPAPQRDFGVFLGEKRSSSMNRPVEEACRWSLLSALLFLQSVAKQHGANAVVGVHSLDGDQPIPRGTDFACTSSGFSNYVRLRARIVILPAQH
jgi:hypothetical protein